MNMRKTTLKTAALLALLLALSAAVCLAETETETYRQYIDPTPDGHTVVEETWVYTIVDGERVSGRPDGAIAYPEPHTMEGGVCVCCGYSGQPDVVTPVPGGAIPKPAQPLQPAAPADDRGGDEASVSTHEAPSPVTFTVAAGVTLTRGQGAAEALGAVLRALPDDAEVKVLDVDEALGDALLAQLRSGDDPQALAELLRQFPAEAVNGVSCRVVTLQYSDATERYAFSDADGSLFSVY